MAFDKYQQDRKKGHHQRFKKEHQFPEFPWNKSFTKTIEIFQRLKNINLDP